MANWIFKSEPEDYSFDDLVRDTAVRWDGIRNYGARNNVRACRPGDLVLFYHSGRNPSVVALARVTSEPYPDPTQFDAENDYADPKSDPDDPRWWSVDIEPDRPLEHPVSLANLKADPRFEDMLLVRRSRLSVSPVTDEQLRDILELATLSSV